MKCLQCGRELHDQESVRREIGPVCYSRLKGKEKRQELLPEERILTVETGGEIADLIRRTFHGRYECIGGSSSHIEPVESWYGYPHDGGLSDGTGKRWWVYQKCSQSNYETAWWKVEKRIAKLETLEAAL